MTDNVVKVETIFDEMQFQYSNGRIAGRLKGRLSSLRLESAFSGKKREYYRGEMEQTKEDLEYIPEPKNLIGLLAFEFGKFIG
jgi:hypothetical protein